MRGWRSADVPSVHAARREGQPATVTGLRAAFPEPAASDTPRSSPDTSRHRARLTLHSPRTISGACRGCVTTPKRTTACTCISRACTCEYPADRVGNTSVFNSLLRFGVECLTGSAACGTNTGCGVINYRVNTSGAGADLQRTRVPHKGLAASCARFARGLSFGNRSSAAGEVRVLLVLANRSCAHALMRSLPAAPGKGQLKPK